MTKGLGNLLAIHLILLLPCLLRAGPPERDLAARIDYWITARLSAVKVQPAAQADDAEFLRRVYLDLAGRIPSLEEARMFLDDRTPDKRQRLIEKLLAGPDYVKHFTNYWRHLLLSDENGNAEIQRLTPVFEAWLRKQIAGNVPYDKMVREIVTLPLASSASSSSRASPQAEPGEPGPEAFYLAKDVKPENLAASTARVFLGIRLECAQCHHHPNARWQREQFWGYAAFFAGLQRQGREDGPPSGIREIFDRRELRIPGTDQIVPAVFLDGKDPRWKPRVGARTALAEWMTARENPFFARAAVNRLWAHFFGVGLVEPYDDLEGQNKPSHPELLDELARAFIEHDYDWKLLIRAITASQGYQRSSAGATAPEDPQLFARMALKGLTPEQIFDSFLRATGYQAEAGWLTRGASAADVARARSSFLALYATNQTDKRTETQTSILQALTLMNGSFVHEVIQLHGSGTLARAIRSESLSMPQKVEMLFLATLSRRPTTDESQRLVTFLATRPRALPDVFWALLNSGEFLVNH